MKRNVVAVQTIFLISFTFFCSSVGNGRTIHKCLENEVLLSTIDRQNEVEFRLSNINHWLYRIRVTSQKCLVALGNVCINPEATP